MVKKTLTPKNIGKNVISLIELLGSGSYGKLAEFKAEVLNKTVKKHDIENVIELGCGDGNQLRLAEYKEYQGFDVSRKAVQICRKIFKNDSSKKFYKYELLEKRGFQADLVLSLDVIFHLIEDSVYEGYMKNLFNLLNKYVIIYSSNYDLQTDVHVKSRKFTNWINENVKDEFEQIAYIKNRYPFEIENPNDTSFSDFYIFKRII